MNGIGVASASICYGASASICYGAGAIGAAQTAGGSFALSSSACPRVGAGAGLGSYELGSFMKSVGKGDGGKKVDKNNNYNYNQDKELSNGEIDKIKKGGYDIHDLKPNSKFDLFKDRNGNIYYKRKTGKGYSEIEYIDLNINNF